MIGLLLVGLGVTSTPATIEGNWLGALDVGAMRLRIGLHVERTAGGSGDGAFRGTLSSLDQGMHDKPVDRVVVSGNDVHVEMSALSVQIDGKLAGDTLECQFTQRGNALPLSMKRVASFAAAKRPQEPKRPFPYREEEVTVTVPSSYGPVRAVVLEKLAGTLTLPEGKGPFPAVLLVNGSGAQDRDETLFEHKPFLVLSDALTHAGIATLRFDDRGVGKSQGSMKNMTTLDLAEDARKQFELLASRREIDKRRIGIIGHSEGGLIAPILAAQSTLPRFLVLLAGSGLKGFDVLDGQSLALLRALGDSEASIAAKQKLNHAVWRVLADNDPSTSEPKLRAVLKDAPELLPSTLEAAAWMHTFLTLDPATYLAKVKVPVLALAGARDMQVLPANLLAIERALRNDGNTHVTTVLYPGLNHLFQHCTTGQPSEYGTIEETMSPDVIAKVREFVLAQQ